MSTIQHRRKPNFRFPFDIDRRVFLAFSILFFVLAIKPINEKINPRNTLSTIKNKLGRTFTISYDDFHNIISDKQLITDLIDNKVSQKKLSFLYNKPWGFSILDTTQKMIFWSTDKIIFDQIPSEINILKPYSSNGFVGLIIKTPINYKKRDYFLVANFPLSKKYINENEYLKSYLVLNSGSNKDDYGYELTPLLPGEHVQKKDALFIEEEPLFKIDEKTDLLDNYDRSILRIFLAFLSFIFFGISFHTYFKVSVRRNPNLYFILLLISVLVIRILGYVYGFPDDFREFNLFNPEVYGSGIINKSLGDVFINACLTFWLLFFFAINVQFKQPTFLTKMSTKQKLVVNLIFLIFAGYYSLHTFKSLIEDTTLNYDTTYYGNICFESLIGLATLLILFSNYMLCCIIVNRYIGKSSKIKFIKYLTPVVLAFLSTLFTKDGNAVPLFSILIWTSLFLLLLDLQFAQLKFDFSSYRLLYWIIFLAASCSIMINYLVSQKEIQTRIDEAYQVLKFQNKQTEARLLDLKNSIGEDKQLIQTLTQGKRSEIIRAEQKLNSTYMSIFNGQYYPTFYFVTKDGQDFNSLRSDKITTLQRLCTSENKIGNKGLYFIDQLGYQKYILRITLSNLASSSEIKSLWIVLQPENQLNTFSSVELTQPAKLNVPQAPNLYNIAYYTNGILVRQQGNSPFNYLDSKSNRSVTLISSFKSLFNTYNESRVELYSGGNSVNKTILIRKKNNRLYQFTTTYAYVFTLIFLVISLYIFGNMIARSNFKRKRLLNLIGLTLRMRINLAILLVELISFTIIGSITIYFYTNRSNEHIVRDTIELNQDIIQKTESLPKLDSLFSGISNYEIAAYDIFNKSVLEISKNRFLIYDLQGRLLFSNSHFKQYNDIYSDRINPLFLNELRRSNRLYFEKIENVGSLNYYSVYRYIRNKHQKPIAILQNPSLSSEQIVKTDISNVVITLINIYAFVFLLSSGISYLITRRITRSFTQIVRQFSKINLTQTNAPLQWPHSDEIGLLVKEYNRTLLKLENSTALLAKNEREMAWREMAKQIAHEIKNPLTPMRLSLQILQKAIRNNAPNVPELTNRMTETVLEQITLLTRIASNFSEFAKMVDVNAKKESLLDILKTATGIYSDTEEIQFLFLLPSNDIFVFVDKVKIIRVITNIIQNAIQSIEEGKTGYITLNVEKIKTNFVRISINDNGIGIADEQINKIFQPNFTTKNSGSGLGLAMCKDIMIKTGGDISFETEVGQGSTFHMDIPLFVEKEEKGVESEKSEDLTQLQEMYGITSDDELDDENDDSEDDIIIEEDEDDEEDEDEDEEDD